jgi:hypothetical protein
MRQTAYQILVASDPSHLDSNTGDMWDSGQVVSSEDTDILYAGKALNSNTTYYWKVRTWENDEVDFYSDIRTFSMGNHLISISPETSVESDSWITVTFNITVGEGGLAVGDGFSILSPTAGNRFRWNPPHLIWTTWQTTNSTGSGYTSASTSRAGAVVIPSVFGNRKVLNVTVGGDTALEPGDIVTVIYGNKSKGGPGVNVSVLAQRYFFPLGKHNDPGDTWGSMSWDKFKNAPCIRIVGKPAAKFHVVAQPLQKAGNQFALKVSAIDESGNLDVGYNGNVSFNSTDLSSVLPESYTFTGLDRGFHHFKVTLNTEGFQTISVSDGSMSGTSNVIKAHSVVPEKGIFFGDIHGHSWFSDGMIWIDDHFSYPRDAAGLDFAAVTDHSEAAYNFKSEFIVPYVNKYHAPHRFVTFHANEWTRAGCDLPQGSFGHFNPLFLHENEFIVTPYTTYMKPEDLWNALAGKEVIAPPHHTGASINCGAAGMDLVHYNSAYMPCVEIASKHGISECTPSDITGNPIPLRSGMDPKRSVQYALGTLGYKWGVYGSSDTHAFRLGDLFYGGDKYETSYLAAVYAPEQTREAIYHAIKNRRIYGTSGERILLEFNVDGHPMGSEYWQNISESPHIDVTVGGTHEIADVIVLKYSDKNGWQKIHTEYPSALTCSFNYEDQNFNENSLYYVRVTQDSDPVELAWSSPVWANAYAQYPYPDSALSSSIPGTIEAENFDTGGEGFAYHDSSSENEGGKYRIDEAVDIETCSKGGYNIRDIVDREWFEYTVDVKYAGKYDISLETASESGGGTLCIKMDDVDMSGLVTLPVTDSGQTWKITTVTGVNLSESKQVMRIEILAGSFNLNKFIFNASTIKPPSSPGGMGALDVSYNQIELTWIDNSDDEVQFRIERSSDETIGWEEIGLTGADVTHYFDTGLNASTTYYYRVRASNSAGNSDYSNTAGATTQDIPLPSAPVNLNATAVSSSQIDLAWTDNADNEDGFRIERKTGANTFQEIAIVEADVTDYSDKGLAESATYIYRICAYNDGGNSVYSNIDSATTFLSGQISYYGAPLKIPGIIEAEDFDRGGEGIAYHDLTATNQGGKYRTDENVDIENCSQGGYNIGWTSDGEWLEYTVDAASTGPYQIELITSSANAGGTLRVIMDGIDIPGKVSLPVTGGWQTWETTTVSDVTLTPGEQVMLVEIISKGFNFDKIVFNDGTGIDGKKNCLRILS